MDTRKLAGLAVGLILFAFVLAMAGKTAPAQAAPVGAPGSTTITVQIAAYRDDAWQNGSILTSDGTTLWIGDNGNPNQSYAGFRFAGVAIPRGATVQSAQLNLYSTAAQSSPIQVNILGDARGNSAPFSGSNLPGSRASTAAVVPYNNPTPWAANTWYGIDVAPIVQEIVNRSDWTSGNALSLIAKGTSGITRNRRAVKAVSSVNNSNRIWLAIVYTTAETPSPTPFPPTATRVPPTATRVPPTGTPIPTTTTTVPPTATTSPTTTPVPPTATPPGGALWRPAMNTSWHILLDHPINVNDAKDMGLVDPQGNPLSAPAPQLYDVDAFFNGQDPNCNIKDANGVCAQGENNAVAQLHTMGKKVLCYIDFGVYETYRPDAYKFPASVIGNADEGWGGSYWLDIRRTDILGPIMRARMQMCKDKGYDGIDPDEINGYTYNTGFPLTYADQINYNIFIANMAHSMGMPIGLKNDIEQASDLVGHFEWTLNEECFQYSECSLLNPFSNAGKAVFEIEYAVSMSSFCPTSNANNWNSMLMPLALDGGRKPCR